MKHSLLIVALLISFSLHAKTVAIIGGGMAGVSTAAFLKKTDLEVHLFEKEAKLGGHARTHLLKGESGQPVNVDLGPQYLAKDGWDLYTDFLKYFTLFDENNFYSYISDMTIYKKGQQYPDFTNDQTSPIFIKWLFKKDNALARLISMFDFLDYGHKFNLQEEKENISLAEFLDNAKIKKQFQEEIVKPLVGTAFTCPYNLIDDLSAIASTGTLAFRRALSTPEWLVSKFGMQTYIEQIAQKNQLGWDKFFIHLSSPVEEVLKNQDGTFKIIYANGKEMDVDYVVTTVHTPVLKKLLKSWESFEGMWEKFPHTNTRVVIHDNQKLLHPEFQSFYNVMARNEGKSLMQMKLSKIDPGFGKLIKAWGLTEAEYLELKENGHIRAEAMFIHPLITTSFLEGIKELKEIAAYEPNFFVAGGWSENFETQYQSILSGYRAAKGIAPYIVPYWEKHFESLKKAP